ncbi:MAG: hypothetical protein DDT35_00940 [Firmicutes bacterium]|nr:hypothetical protein [Bacillota bacterium]
MSALTLYQGLVNSLATAPLHTFYVFTGVEEWYVCAAAHAVINGAFIGQDEALRSFNLVELDGEDPQLPRIRQEIQTPPFFAGHKVVRVRQAKFLKGTKAQEAENSKFPLAVTARNTTLICEAESINQKSGLLKGQQVHAVNFTFANRRDAALAAQTIVRRELAASAIEIDMQALNQIILLIGVNEKQPFVRSLLQEVQKIMAYKNFRGSISLADVNKLVTRSAEARLWDVTDALMAKKVEPALKHLHEIVQDGEEPLAMLGGLASFFRQLLLAKEMIDRNGLQHASLSVRPRN